MSFNLQRLADEQSASLYFTCSQCGSPCSMKHAREGCAQCTGTLFKVARWSTINQPMIDDPESQEDPYRTKQNSPERGMQFNNFGGEGTPTSSIGGPTSRQPLNQQHANPDNTSLPSDGYGSDTPAKSYVDQVPDGSALAQPTQQRDANPFNAMRSQSTLNSEDPYDLVRKRKFK